MDPIEEENAKIRAQYRARPGDDVSIDVSWWFVPAAFCLLMLLAGSFLLGVRRGRGEGRAQVERTEAAIGMGGFRYRHWGKDGIYDSETGKTTKYEDLKKEPFTPLVQTGDTVISGSKIQRDAAIAEIQAIISESIELTLTTETVEKKLRAHMERMRP